MSSGAYAFSAGLGFQAPGRSHGCHAVLRKEHGLRLTRASQFAKDSVSWIRLSRQLFQFPVKGHFLSGQLLWNHHFRSN